jgi:hypothetical protein
MSTPHRCPVCKGYGTVSKPPHIAGDQDFWTDSGGGPYTCPACRGFGVLWPPPFCAELDYSNPQSTTIPGYYYYRPSVTFIPGTYHYPSITYHDRGAS